MWKLHSFTPASRAIHNTPAGYAEQGCCNATLKGGRAPRLAPHLLPAVPDNTTPRYCNTFSHSSFLKASQHYKPQFKSLSLGMASKNKPAYLPKLPGSYSKTCTESQKAFFAERQNVLWSLHTFNPERMVLLRVYGKPDRKPCCHHPSQTGTPHGQQCSSAMLWPGSLFPVLYSSPAPGQVSGVPICIQTLTAIDRRSAILHMDRFTQGYIYIKLCASES